MKRRAVAIGVGLLLAYGILGFAAAFALASSSKAAATGTTSSTTEDTTTETTTTTTTSPPTTTPSPRPEPALIAPGVQVGNVLVGWLTPRLAAQKVERAFARPLQLVVSQTRRIEVTPRKLGARAQIEKAIRRARSARPGVVVPLDVDVSWNRIHTYVEELGRSLDRQPVDAKVVLRGLVPDVVPSADGRRLRRLKNALELRLALKTHVRDSIPLAFSVLRPKVTAAKLGPAIVIERGSNTLLFYKRETLDRTFRVATGQPAYPTPLGSFVIVVKERDPWWYPPPSPWAAGESPIPPGPGNPLGTRWMGLSAPDVGIHGTPDAASIGYSASHGCIRMHIPDAEWLFNHVTVGTPVFIVAR